MNAKFCVVLWCGLQLAVIGCSTNPARSMSSATPLPSPTVANESVALTTSSPSSLTENANSDLSAVQDSASKKVSPSGNKDACALITNAEIAAVQGEAVKEAKTTNITNQGFNISQCFYTLPTFYKSISFEITRAGAGTKDQNALRELWESKFGERAGKKDKDREEEEERQGENHRPERVPGVGREAVWVAGRSGALYVLTNKNAYLRISIGGNESDQTKIMKTKTLAQQAIKRL